MTILAIESSCDETSASVLVQKANQIVVKSLVTSTSLELHAITGGVIPEVAAREQIRYIIPAIQQALMETFQYEMTTSAPPIDAIAVTYGPGLIGSLLVGVETAKTLSLLWNLPLIPVNHMYGHIYANYITQIGKQITENQPEFPSIALIVSGGHTDLLFMRSHTQIEHIGQTRDDAAGEAFDKIGRLLGLAYPAGPKIAELAKNGDRTRFTLPRPMIGSHDLDFSFSGLKTSVLNLLKSENLDFSEESLSSGKSQTLADICASVEYSIVNVLTRKTQKAIEKYKPKSLLVGGGVSANTALKQSLIAMSEEQDVAIFIPEKNLCTDNAAMIGANAFFLANRTNTTEITALPNLSYI